MVATEYNSPQIIIDNLHSAVVVIGEHLQIICMNPAAEMLFHISNNRAANKNIRELIINEHEFFDRLERSLISHHPYTVYDDHLHVHNHKTIDVDYSVSPLQYLPEGKFLLLEFIRLKTKQKLSHEESILSQYEASKSLLRGLAHEIKNPLGGIRGAAQLLERELESDSDKQFMAQLLLWTSYLTRADYNKALDTALQLHSLAQNTRKKSQMAEANLALGMVWLYRGEFGLAHEHLEAVITSPDLQEQNLFLAPVGQDIRMTALISSARALWYLGYPDQALERSQLAIAQMHCYLLNTGAMRPVGSPAVGMVLQRRLPVQPAP